MKALLWKDYRINRTVLIAAFVLLIAPLAAVVAVNGYSNARYATTLWPWPTALQAAATLSMALSMITAALLGGSAFASERADRSAEFLAYLPPTRAQILTSKATLILSSLIVIWTLNLILIYAVAPHTGVIHPELAETLRDARERLLYPLLATTACMFGVAWFGSAILSSQGIAAGLSFGAPPLLVGILQAIAFITEAPDLTAAWLPTTFLLVGVAGFVGGTIVYLRRIEP